MSRTLLHPASAKAPKYWKYEAGGNLVPAMERYLALDALTVQDIALIVAYLRQWVDSPVWQMNPYATGFDNLDDLRSRTARARSKRDIDECVSLAIDLGMDPL
jgi:hypothetical protein